MSGKPDRRCAREIYECAYILKKSSKRALTCSIDEQLVVDVQL